MALILFDKPENCLVFLTLNRPEKLNALSTALFHELSASLDAAEAGSDVRIDIVTGAGEKAFAAGRGAAYAAGARTGGAVPPLLLRGRTGGHRRLPRETRSSIQRRLT